MTARIRIFRLVGPLVAVGLIAPLGAISASASQASRTLPGAATDCPSGYLCLWEDVNFQGRMLRFRDSGVQDLGKWRFKDKTSSAYNKTGRPVQLINTYYLRNDIFPLSANHYSALLTTYPAPGGGTWNDKVDKIKIG